VDSVVQSAVENEVRGILEEIKSIGSSSIKIVDSFIAKFVDSCLEQLIKEEMHKEILQIGEGTCDCSVEIAALQEELAACKTKLNCSVHLLGFLFNVSSATVS